MTKVRTVSCSICAADMPPTPAPCGRCGFDPAEIERLERELVRLEDQRNWGTVIFVVGLVASSVLYLSFGAIGTMLFVLTLFAGPWRLVHSLGAMLRTRRAIREAYRPRQLPPARVVPR